MLAGYPPAVLDRAASPSRGLPAFIAYPNLAKFKERLDGWYDEHLEAIQRRLVEKPVLDHKRSPPPLPEGWNLPGRLANVHVPAEHPRYARLVEWAKTVDDRWWKFGKSSDGRDGIWVPLNIWQDGQEAMRAIATVQTMTPEQLREHYAAHALARMPKSRDTAEDAA